MMTFAEAAARLGEVMREAYERGRAEEFRDVLDHAQWHIEESKRLGLGVDQFETLRVTLESRGHRGWQRLTRLTIANSDNRGEGGGSDGT